MNGTEATKLLMIIQVCFPNFKPQNKELTINVWTDMLKGYDYKQCELALKTYIATDTSGFAPSIGQIINLIHLPEEKSYPSEHEAWAMISKACSNGNYGYKEEYARLPEVIKKAVGNERNIHEWAAVSIDEFQTVIHSNFLRSYRAAVNGEKEMRKLPKEMRLLIENTTRKMIGG